MVNQRVILNHTSESVIAYDSIGQMIELLPTMSWDAEFIVGKGSKKKKLKVVRLVTDEGYRRLNKQEREETEYAHVVHLNQGRGHHQVAHIELINDELTPEKKRIYPVTGREYELFDKEHNFHRVLDD